MNQLMPGWMDESIDARVDESIHGWLERWITQLMPGWMDYSIDARMD